MHRQGLRWQQGTDLLLLVRLIWKLRQIDVGSEHSITVEHIGIDPTQTSATSQSQELLSEAPCSATYHVLSIRLEDATM